MLLGIIKKLLQSLIGLVALSFLMLIAFSPIHVPQLKHHVEQKLIAISSNAKVRDVTLEWNWSLMRPVISLYELQVDQYDIPKVNISWSATKDHRLTIYIEQATLNLDALFNHGASTTAFNIPAISCYLNKPLVRYANNQQLFDSIEVIIDRTTTIHIRQSRSTPLLTLDVKHSEPNTPVIAYLDSKPIIRGNFAAGHLSAALARAIEVRELFNLWPPLFAPSVREWLHTNLQTASIDKASLDFGIDNGVVGNINISKAALSYLENGPQLESLQTEIAINNDQITIKPINAVMLGVSLFEGEVQISNIKNQPQLSFTTAIDASIPQAATILKAHFPSTKIDLPDMQGNGTLKIGGVLLLEEPEKVDLSINGSFSNIEMKKIWGEHYISDGALTAVYKNNKFTAAGKVMINQALPAKVNYELSSFHTLSEESKINMNFILTPKILKKLNIEAPSFFSKPLPINYQYARNSSGEYNSFAIKLANLPPHPATALFAEDIINSAVLSGKFTVQPGGEIIVNDYRLVADRLSSQGKMLLTKNFEVMDIESSNSRINQSAFSFHYHNEPHQHNINLKGELDITPLVINELGSLDTQAGKLFNLTSQLTKIKAHNGIVLYKPQLAAKYGPHIPSYFLLKGNLNDKKAFHMEFRSPSFFWRSDNAGASLASLDLYKSMIDGKLSITATAKENGAYEGVIDIADYYLVHAPILTNLLALTSASSGSFRGLVNVARKKGMHFKTMHCPFTCQKNTMEFSDCYQKGDSLRMTAKGVVNYHTGALQVGGVLTPQNLLNSIAQNLPIIKQLTNGELIAMNYNLQGNINHKIKMRVNPFSIFIPGGMKNALQPKLKSMHKLVNKKT